MTPKYGKGWDGGRYLMEYSIRWPGREKSGKDTSILVGVGGMFGQWREER